MATNKSTQTSIAVWLDHIHAVVIPVESSSDRILHIQSQHESRIRIPGEGNDGAILGVHRSSTDETSKNERKHHELHDFYASIAQAVQGIDDLLIFGPTTAPREFSHYLRERKDFDATRMSILSSDYITENQMRKVAHEHFERHANVPNTKM